ncbi:hypothetical protein [Streptomyces sp. 8N706]|uniref:hypothetical protein n=1 Tax=Streptomyces sp. 8N706 TaxID=3457416 RepID=UPI003FCEF3D6
MADVLTEITRRLASGESLEAISRHLRPTEWRPLLRVCAAARTFDRPLFDAVLRPFALRYGREVPSLEGLLTALAVEPVPGGGDTYALPEDNRAAYFLEWFDQVGADTVPGDLIELEQRIAAFWRAAGNRAEEVRHLLLTSPQEALDLFETLFAEADERRDFAACQDLVDVLADPDRLPRAGPDAERLRVDRAGYVRARAYWAADYARSAQFLHPPGLVEDAERLLSGEDRVWQMYAPGGAGKTMQLRWLVARYCVPAERDVLCARIDFDVVSPLGAGRHPWLLLLEAAEQFGRRLPGRPFERLDDYAAYRVLLNRRPSGPARDAARNIATLDQEAVEEEVLDTFATRLNLARPDQPSVLVLDTIEEVLLRGHGDATRLLAMLGRLLERCPGLRLILAGRYDLREPERIPQALASLPERVRHIEVRPFDAQQARTYLAQVRGIRNPRLAEIAAAKSNGLPFVLALFADLIEQDPDISAPDLEVCDEPLVRYLIDRVVCRIDDRAVRWLLRYGVIPRRLRFDDVRTLMRPWLVRGITKTGGDDDPREDRHHLRGSEDIFPFADSGPTEEEMERAWKRLLDYAGGSSWVSLAAGDDATIVFHTNVVAPMRQLISDKPVFGQLHRAFVEHFEALAKSAPEQWLTCVKEAVYHRFQAGVPEAEPLWMTAVGELLSSGRPGPLRELAEEILGDEYVDGDEPRRRLDGSSLVSDPALATAHLAVASAELERVMESESVDRSDPVWSEIESRLARLDQLRQRSSVPIPTQSAEAMLRAFVTVAHGRPEEGVRALERAVESETDELWRQVLRRALARLQSHLRDPNAEVTYRQAIQTARAQGAYVEAAQIALELANDQGERGRFDEAVALHDRALSLVREAPDFRAVALLHKARTQLRTFAPTAALETLEALAAPEPAQQSEGHRLRAEALSLLGRSRQALEALEQADLSAGRVEDETRYRHLAQNAMLRGLVEGALLALDRAEQAFDQATSFWTDLGFVNGHPECLLMYAEFLARDVGDLGRAAHSLQRLPEADPSGEYAVRTALLWHELALQGYDVPDSSLLEIPLRTDRDLLTGGVCAVLVDPGRAAALADAVASVQPPEARLSILEGLAYFPVPEGGPPAELDLLRKRLEPVVTAEPVDTDLPVRLAGLAAFEHAAGHRPAARRLTTRAHRALCSASGNDPMALWRWARTELRCDVVPGRRQAELLAEAARPVSPLLSAVGSWLTAMSAPTTAPDKSSLLYETAEALSRLHPPSVWAVRILHAVAQANADESTRAAADRLASLLGQRSHEPARASRLVYGLIPPGSENVVVLRRTDRTDTAPRRLAESLLKDWPKATRDMSRTVGLHPATFRGEAPLRLESDDVLLHAAPWELALGSQAMAYRTLPDPAESAQVRALQAALNQSQASGMHLTTDGIWGRATHGALAAAIGLPGLFPAASLSGAVMTSVWELMRDARARSRARRGTRTVVLLRGAQRDSDALSSGQEGLGAVPRRIYTAHDCAVEQWRSMRSVPNRWVVPPAVVHVNAPLRLKGSLPYFDLSPVNRGERLSSKASGSDLDAGRLVNWLARFEPGTAPLVVLDPPFPGSPADIPYQLVLRNLFAAVLFASGVAPAVLGTGLVRRPHRQLDVLAQGIAADAPLLGVLEDLRAVGAEPYGLAGTEWGDDRLATACTSLFAVPSMLHLAKAS